MDTIPVELLTMIAVDSFDIFVTLLRVPMIGVRLCDYYPQLIARGRFIRVVENNNDKFTYLNNRLHSFNDWPAYISKDGDKYWWWHGERHRENEQPAIECTDGSKFWYVNGKFIKSN